MYLRSPVAAYIRAHTGGAINNASHHHHGNSLPGTVDNRGPASTASNCSCVGPIMVAFIAGSFFNR